MKEVELLVGLKIPDTTAITAFHTLEKLGYKIKELKRKLYYKFFVEGDADKFCKEIVKTDIIVNANKNTAEIGIKEKNKIKILVQDIDDGGVLLTTLQESLGFKNIKKMEKGILWIMDVNKETAEKIAKDLLANEHYQKYEVVK